MFGNPHSASPSSTAHDARSSSRRARRCSTTSTRADDYTAIFTPNATGALKLVGESYPFAPGGRLLLTFDNHNSVNGIREFARAKGAAVDYAPLTRARAAHRSRRPCSARSTQADRGAARTCSRFRRSRTSPASSIRSRSVDAAHAQGWDVLLDAAAFVPTNRLDLQRGRARLRRGLVLQDVRLPDRRRLPARAQRGAREAAAPLVRRRHGELRDRAGPRARARAAARPASRTARSTTSASRRSRSAFAISSASASTRFRRACDCLTAWLLTRAARAAPRQRPPDGADLRSRDQAQRGGDGHAELLRSGRPPARLPARRGTRRPERHLAAHRMLLQPRRGRDGGRADGRRHARRAGGRAPT